MRYLRRLGRNAWQLVFLAFTIAWSYPLIWAVVSSLKTNKELLSGSVSLLPSAFHWSDLSAGRWHEIGAAFKWANFSYAWYVASFEQYFLNSAIVTVSAVAIVLAMSCMSGYALGRYRFPGKKIVIVVFTVVAFLPEGYTIIPIWQLVRTLHIANSRLGLIVAISSGGHLLYLLLFAAFFAGIPKELEEAAILDGAGFVRTFWMLLPLAKPAIASVAILEFIRAWNDFFMPLVFTASKPDLQTIAVGIYENFTNGNTSDLASMSAGVVIAFAPVIVVFLLLQRYFVEGIAGAVKA